MENLNTALGLLVVGMVTVFIILCLVVVIGNLVIRLTNRFIPVAGPAAGTSGNGDAAGKRTHSKKLAVIVAAVDVVTHGQGNVESIERK
ncbi:OadG family protein [Proteiniphilum sp. X52]|uniref:OadG family protein n=1 Tax=Proteiniphilum sp. X52 TaxID=2382159 RepID=UPI000F0A5322|nr:OadG family transporter subunit [Proteiniphilum sp. X52]RNC65931.1 oxaloacetate decarboxylase [Proteiniphilum sp. X52]